MVMAMVMPMIMMMSLAVTLIDSIHVEDARVIFGERARYGVLGADGDRVDWSILD